MAGGCAPAPLAVSTGEATRGGARPSGGTSVLDIDPATYTPHPSHGADRTWTETNCYHDIWVEMLHALGDDPLAMGGYVAACDFDGSQWTLFKPPTEDVRRLYGIDVAELNVWRPVEDHIEEQLGYGRLLTVEVDAYHLPDTAGVSYRLAHTKTTIVPNRLDRSGRRLGYFHGPGYFEVEGADLDGLWGASPLAPYTETVRLDGMDRRAADLVADAVDVTRRHLGERPATNPVARLADRLERDVPWLMKADMDTFHQYAFGTCRQCGAAAQVLADHAAWLEEHGVPGLRGAMDDLRAVAEGAKSLQFTLARASLRSRVPDIAGLTSDMAAGWERALRLLDDRLPR